MKKYMFLFQGAWEMTQQQKDAWGAWFAEIGESVVDSGNPFGPGREVTPTGRRDLPVNADATTGYTIVNAESMEAAEKLLENCPILTSVEIYEAMMM
ncbi:MAG: hypothetical protein ACRDVK_11285 [Acidimicrobiia bacterium]